MGLDVTSSTAWLELARVVGLVSVAYVAVLWLAMLVWVYRDISARTNDLFTRATSVALVVLLFVPGLLAYMALRPRETRAESFSRRLETEAFAAEIGQVRQCPQCRRAAGDDFVVCPYCRATLRLPCGDCGQLLAQDWTACPFCASPRTSPAVPASRTPTPSERAPEPGARPVVTPRAAVQLQR